MALTNAGLNFMAGAVLGQGTPFNATNAYIGVGDGQAAFSAGQTDLAGTNKFRKGMDDGMPLLNAPSVTFRSTFGADEANFSWHEWGVFNAATGGIMLNRVVESNGTKQGNQTWILEVEITFSISN